MYRTAARDVWFCALLGLACANPVGAQTADANIDRAQQTVADIERLLDSIQDRRSNVPVAPGPAVRIDSDSLFDGRSLGGWKRTDFRGGGAVHVDTKFRGGPPAIVVDAGSSLSGITWTKDAPTTNFEVTLEALKIEGSDFMCGLTFPVGSSHATLILGGWGGYVMGISSIDGNDASENDTTRSMSFAKDRWYAIRMRVTPAKLETWLDGRKIVDEDITGKKIGLRFGEISKSVPLGIATYQTSAAYRSIKLHRLEK